MFFSLTSDMGTDNINEMDKVILMNIFTNFLSTSPIN